MLRQRARKIAGWVWDSNKRYRPLIEFSRGPVGEKKAWAILLFREAVRLFRNPIGQLTPFENTRALDWQKAGADFLRQFYKELRGSGIPPYLFSDTGTAFKAQTFLESFRNENTFLCVCPACDDEGYYTISEGSILAEIDHYFPKSVYPHLAIHPFNLVPLCHGCNSWIKGDRDPLEKENGGRRELQDVWLPYRQAGLSKKTFLDVHFPADHRSAEFREIKPWTDYEPRETIAVLGEVYRLPKRWSENKDRIGDKLFRRMRQYSHIVLSGETIGVQNVSNCFSALLGLFQEEDLARESFVYPMTWWLSKLIEQELGSEETPLMQEVTSWVQLPL
jgi:hypothetical protein